MKKTILAALCALLAACEQRPQVDTRMSVDFPTSPSARIEVTRVGVINDTLAYGDRRGLYVIRDTQTGQEFIGVSGVGITEVGAHQAGKTSVRDER
jgi:hypothetical protein